VIYLSETQVCIPLFDPHSVIQALKAQINPYPVLLKQTIIADCLWMAEFTLMQCDNFADAGDTYNTVGCFTRITNYLVHALFAINETYPLGDKRAIQLIKTFSKAPLEITTTLNRVLGQAGTQAEELKASTALLRELWKEIVTLTAGAYQPKFKVDAQ
jgi:hypothetical protein